MIYLHQLDDAARMPVRCSRTSTLHVFYREFCIPTSEFNLRQKHRSRREDEK
jgi:hypothetical protein